MQITTTKDPNLVAQVREFMKKANLNGEDALQSMLHTIQHLLDTGQMDWDKTKPIKFTYNNRDPLPVCSTGYRNKKGHRVPVPRTVYTSPEALSERYANYKANKGSFILSLFQYVRLQFSKIKAKVDKFFARRWRFGHSR